MVAYATPKALPGLRLLSSDDQLQRDIRLQAVRISEAEEEQIRLGWELRRLSHERSRDRFLVGDGQKLPLFSSFRSDNPG
jgi:hypothetical protein